MVLSPFCLITSVSSANKNSDDKLKKSPNGLLHFSNIWGDLIDGNCKKPTTTITNKSANDWLSAQPNISHNL